MSEKIIVNKLRSWLLSNEYEILQLVYPGAQATYSIYYFDGELKTKKLIYPDLICFDKQYIVIGEAKSAYSDEDERKLTSLKNGIDTENVILGLLKRVYKREFIDYQIIYTLINSDTARRPSSEVSHILIDNDEVLFQL